MLDLYCEGLTRTMVDDYDKDVMKALNRQDFTSMVTSTYFPSTSPQKSYREDKGSSTSSQHPLTSDQENINPRRENATQGDVSINDDVSMIGLQRQNEIETFQELPDSILALTTFIRDVLRVTIFIFSLYII